MNGNFKVGEVLVGQNFLVNPEFNGMECILTRGLHVTASRNDTDGTFFPPEALYEVEWADGFVCVVSPSHLRRKQPPSGELSILNMFVVAPPQRTKEIA